MEGYKTFESFLSIKKTTWCTLNIFKRMQYVCIAILGRGIGKPEKQDIFSV